MQLPSLSQPVQIGSKVAPVDVWVVMACIAISVVVYVWTAVVLGMFYARLSSTPYVNGFGVTEAFVLVTLIAVCGMYVWGAAQLVNRAPSARWFVPILGAVSLLAWVFAPAEEVSSVSLAPGDIRDLGSLDSSLGYLRDLGSGSGFHKNALALVLLIIVNLAICLLPVFSPGFRSYVRRTVPGEIPGSVRASALLAYCTAFISVLGGLDMIIQFAQAPAGMDSEPWKLIVGLLLIVVAGVLVWAGQQICAANPNARASLTIVAILGALVRLILDAYEAPIYVGTWLQVLLTIGAVGSLWAPPSSSFFPARQPRPQQYQEYQ